MMKFCIRVLSLILAINLIASIEAASLNPLDKSAVSCYNGNVPMLDLIPNPYNCQKYYVCAEEEPGRPNHISMDCQPGHDGTPLYYSFRECECDYRENAKCYNLTSPADDADFYKCAKKLEIK